MIGRNSGDVGDCSVAKDPPSIEFGTTGGDSSDVSNGQRLWQFRQREGEVDGFEDDNGWWRQRGSSPFDGGG